MCLGIPMQVMEIRGLNASCRAKGIERDVNLFLLQDQALARGDFVLVHVGYAIQKISPEDARASWDLYERMTGGGHA
jgi:hydrogenase expression/formation protein HypC